MLLGQPPGGWPRLAGYASASPQTARLGGGQRLPGFGGPIPMGAGRFLPAGWQPGLGVAGGGYALQPYGFSPAPAMAAVGARPFVPGQSLHAQARPMAMPSSWPPEMQHRYLLLQNLGRPMTPSMFEMWWNARQSRDGGGGFEGRGPAKAGGGQYGGRGPGNFGH